MLIQAKFSVPLVAGDNEVSLLQRLAMSMKKTDLEKHLAKKLDGRMKTSAVPQRFGKGSAATKEKPQEKSRPAVAKLVPVSCRLPAELVNRLRERATEVRPNPSLERTRTGMALGPPAGVVHHPSSGPSATPALASQLKR
jgi:hypothetical protein